MDYIEKAKTDYPDLKINLISGANFDKTIQMLEEHRLDFIIDTTQVDTNYNNLVIEEIKEVQNIFISNKPIKIKDLKELESQKYILNFEYSSTIKKLPIELPKSKINLIYIKEQLTQADRKFIKEYLKNG